LGIIGCGAVVQKNYVKALSLYPDIDVACVNDLNPAAAAKLAASSGAAISSLEKIKEECTIVVIATPPSSHAALVEEMLVSGRTVICEKPFVGTKSDAEHLTRLTEERSSELFVAHFRRCFPSVRLARSLMESGILGPVTGVSAYEGGRFSWESESGYVYKDPYGGVLFDTGSHTLDMLLYVACLDSGTLETKVTGAERDCPEPSHDLEARVALTREGREIAGHFKFSRSLATANKIRVDCQNGFVELPAGMANYVRLGKPGGRSVIVFARESYGDLMDCFALQFRQMFYPDAERTFAAGNFINLAAVLESLSKAGSGGTAL
jgi:predicted dehydrogenase